MGFGMIGMMMLTTRHIIRLDDSLNQAFTVQIDPQGRRIDFHVVAVDGDGEGGGRW